MYIEIFQFNKDSEIIGNGNASMHSKVHTSRNIFHFSLFKYLYSLFYLFFFFFYKLVDITTTAELNGANLSFPSLLKDDT